jgi:hypothetical protein
MAAKRKPAKPARARSPRKSPLGEKLQAIADDTRVRSPLRNLVWRSRKTDAVTNAEGDDLYWGEALPHEPEPIGKKRMRELKAAAK